MLGNGMHFTLIGLRGGIEGFFIRRASDCHLGLFHGFPFRRAPYPSLIRRVGHVRVFAALGSFMSAGLIAFPLVTEPWAWVFASVARGFLHVGYLRFCGELAERCHHQ